MSRYRYEELFPEQFELLVVDLCRFMLGKGTHGFTKGPDGGRDARFEGKTDGYPSYSSPWSGVTIIQAKHSSRIEASFSDSEFIGNKGSVISKEIPRIKSLYKNKALDHYLLFSNRKLAGNAEDRIKSLITSETGLSSEDIGIIGVDNIDLLLSTNPEIADRHNLDLLSAPLVITRDNLAEVILAMRDALDIASKPIADNPVERTFLAEKNRLNNVSDDEIEPLRSKYLADTSSISDFLANPINVDLRDKYNEAVEEMNERLPHLLELYGSFMAAWFALYDIMTGHDPTLKKNSKLVKALQFYMYWNCDFGKGSIDDSSK